MGPPRAVRRRRLKDLMQLLTGVQYERGGAGASPDCPADAKSGATSVHDLENPECSWTGVMPPPPGGLFSGNLAHLSFPILHASRLHGTDLTSRPLDATFRNRRFLSTDAKAVSPRG